MTLADVKQEQVPMPAAFGPARFLPALGCDFGLQSRSIHSLTRGMMSHSIGGSCL